MTPEQRSQYCRLDLDPETITWQARVEEALSGVSPPVPAFRLRQLC
jgi:hypothetical protein